MSIEPINAAANADRDREDVPLHLAELFEYVRTDKDLDRRAAADNLGEDPATIARLLPCVTASEDVERVADRIHHTGYIMYPSLDAAIKMRRRG